MTEEKEMTLREALEQKLHFAIEGQKYWYSDKDIVIDGGEDLDGTKNTLAIFWIIENLDTQVKIIQDETAD